MATRFYLGYQAPGIPGATVTPHAEWDTVTTPNSAMLRKNKRSQALTSHAVARTVAGLSDVLLWRGVSQPLDVAQTISGTFGGVARFGESNLAADMRVQCIVRVIKNDGTDRGILVGPDTGGLANEFVNTVTRVIPRGGPVAVTPVAAQAGDRIQVEIGYRTHHGGSNTYNGSIVLGDTGADHTLGEGDATALSPWIEFSQDITFYEIGMLPKISADIITKMPGPGRVGRISADVITKMQGMGKLGRLSIDVVLPKGDPTAPQVRWGVPIVAVPQFQVSGSAFYIPSNSGFVPWISGAAIGDLVVIQYENGWTVQVPGGFSAHYGPVAGGNGTGMLVSKILTGADIAAGGVTLTATGGSFPGAGSLAQIRSVAPSVRAFTGAYAGSGFTSIARDSPSMNAGELLLWMSATRANVSMGSSRGVVLGTAAGSNASSGAWQEVVPTSGVYTSTMTASGSGSNQIVQAVAVSLG